MYNIYYILDIIDITHVNIVSVDNFTDAFYIALRFINDHHTLVKFQHIDTSTNTTVTSL